MARSDIGRRLAAELRRLQDLGLGPALGRVTWNPGGRTDIEAEVVDGIVHVYANEPDAAILAVRHEVIHYEIVATKEPYVRVINSLLSGLNEEVYRREECLSEKLSKLLGD